MTVSANAPSAAALPPRITAPVGPWLTPPLTQAECLLRIEAMGQRINGYVQFMCQLGSLDGTSAEAKERSVTVFYERMVVVERQLRSIQDALKLA
jgi:hypothetical protein